MRTRSQTGFAALTTEGAILPADLLRRISEGDASLGGLDPSAYHLPSGERLSEAISRSWSRLQGSWAAFKSARERLPETDAGTTLTRERWLLPLFQELGYGRLTPAKPITIGEKSYAISHGWQHAPLHLVSFRLDLDKRQQGAAGASKSSPHSLVQELLNRSDERLWGVVTSGLRLRILRDNASLSRQAFVEFDLEAIFDGELFADFALLWLLCHQSRVEGDTPGTCWLERWSNTAREQGTRVLERLRAGVEEAITALGTGLLAHPANGRLRERLTAGAFGQQDFYRELLRHIYRLLFLFVAEDRNLLHPPGASAEARRRYNQFFSTQRLRRNAMRLRGSRHPDLFDSLRLVVGWLDSESGRPELGIPALGSFLLSPEAVQETGNCEVANRDLLVAVRALAFTAEGGVRRPVDYRNLGAEELGSIYEALLELHPLVNIDSRTLELASAAGHERKTTGSYYTPTGLIQSLLESALDPVLVEAAARPEPEAAILDLKICDPACGSGHFLIAAAQRIGKKLAEVRTGEAEPAPEAVRTAVRDVIGRCIFGVDINPMAVELCKVSLWLEAIEPGKPLSFLEHHIRCGNSLLGATPDLIRAGIPDAAFDPVEGDDKAVCRELRKRNRSEREGQQSLFQPSGDAWADQSAIRLQLSAIGLISDETVDGIRRRARSWSRVTSSREYLNARFVADVWCAAIVWKKSEEREPPFAITQEVLRKIQESPEATPSGLRHQVETFQEAYRFFHWHLEFPDVFSGDGGNGFDVVLGNPPWDMVEVSDKEFFAERAPAIAGATTARLRQQLIQDLRSADPPLWQRYSDLNRFIAGSRHFIQSCGRYERSSVGRINLYPLFVEAGALMLKPSGRAGLIVPSAISMDAYNASLFGWLLESSRLVSLFDFENSGELFPNVHRSYRFCLLTMCGEGSSTGLLELCYFAHTTDELSDSERRVRLTFDEIREFSPNTLAPPIFKGARDKRIAQACYRQFGVFRDRRPGAVSSWKPSIQRMLSLSDEGDMFRRRTELPETVPPDMVRLYSGKAIHAFNHRFATFDVKDWRPLTAVELADPTCWSVTEYFVRAEEVTARLSGKYPSRWLVGYRDIARATDERTAIAAIVPRVGCDTHCRNIYWNASEPALAGCLVANLNAMVFDYLTRQKVIGTGIGAGILEQLPVVPRERFEDQATWGPESQSVGTWLKPRLLEMTYTAWDLEPFAQELGYLGPPFRWNAERRFLLACELDAAFFHIYGIAREDVEYIMETFPIVKKHDERAYGEYRTKRVIVEIYDEMGRSARCGQPYKTRLDPAPADSHVAHPVAAR